jgi:hypothetical protein
MRIVRWLACCILAGLLGLSMGLPPAALGQETAISKKHHPWGRFSPGAWKLVRVVTETLDQRGVVTSTTITETKTTLDRIDDDGVMMEVEVGMEVAGRQFDGQPQCVRQGFHGEAAGIDVKASPPAAAAVEIDGRKIACRTQKLEFAGPTCKTVTTISYSDTTAPYVLKRESMTTDPEGKEVLGEMDVQVVSLDMPCRILGETKSASHVKIVQKHAQGTITTWAITSPDVPGGVISQSSKETDKTGRLVRRSTLELVGYGLEVEEERIGLFGRKRTVRRKVPLHGTTL